MQDVDHTHPHTDTPFGDAFRRGPDVAADGGERNADEETTESTTTETTTTTMDEVDHTSAEEGVDRTFERGTEGRSDTV